MKFFVSIIVIILSLTSAYIIGTRRHIAIGCSISRRWSAEDRICIRLAIVLLGVMPVTTLVYGAVMGLLLQLTYAGTVTRIVGIVFVLLAILLHDRFIEHLMRRGESRGKREARRRAQKRCQRCVAACTEAGWGETVLDCRNQDMPKCPLSSRWKISSRPNRETGQIERILRKTIGWVDDNDFGFVGVSARYQQESKRLSEHDTSLDSQITAHSGEQTLDGQITAQFSKQISDDQITARLSEQTAQKQVIDIEPFLNPAHIEPFLDPSHAEYPKQAATEQAATKQDTTEIRRATIRACSFMSDDGHGIVIRDDGKEITIRRTWVDQDGATRDDQTKISRDSEDFPSELRGTHSLNFETARLLLSRLNAAKAAASGQ